MRLFLVPACLLLLACSSSTSETSTGPNGPADGGSADAPHSGEPGDAASTSDAPGTTSPDGGDAGIVNPLGLTKVLTGEYATHLLVKGTIYTLSATSYQGVPGASLPPVPIDVPAGTTFIDGQSGLHQSLGVDSTGHVWMWGDNPSGDAGIDGTGSGVLPYQVAHDASGNDFGNVVSVAAGDEADGAIKSDGTVWIWGTCTGGLAGDGNTGNESIVYPTQVAIALPSGVKAAKLVLGATGASGPGAAAATQPTSGRAARPATPRLRSSTCRPTSSTSPSAGASPTRSRATETSTAGATTA
jgi:hypothetical protein